MIKPNCTATHCACHTSLPLPKPTPKSVVAPVQCELLKAHAKKLSKKISVSPDAKAT